MFGTTSGAPGGALRPGVGAVTGTGGRGVGAPCAAWRKTAADVAAATAATQKNLGTVVFT
ncbi:MAG TPA: hypothetical protein DCG89_08245 [Spartobacteria bacterium]|nr:hypothetical protein [Spartobacteria bacterium]